MSEPIDIKALEEYLKGGSDISQRYRDLGRDDVPPELDRRVLDEARAAVAGGGGRSRSWLRWGAPVALAASVVLAVTVVIESGPQNDTSLVTQPASVDKQDARRLEEQKLQAQNAQPPQQESQGLWAPEPPAEIVTNAAPASAPASPPPAASPKKEAQRSNHIAREEVRVDAKALHDQSVVTPVAVDSVVANSPAPQVAVEQPTAALAESSYIAPVRDQGGRSQVEADSSDDDLSSVSVTGSRVRRTGRSVGPRSTISPSGSAASSGTRPAADEEPEQADSRQADSQLSDPQKWLEDIRELRRAGKAAEADRAWKQFREAFPNFPVPDDDLARKQR